ncbi:MAG: malto-oligosyltrehalose synthase [Candidatus Acidiferrum sp.]
MPLARIPSATYRLQFNESFRFVDASRIVDYLCDLGISDVYASPILTSRKGSGHGYDVTDPTRVDPDLGSEEDFETLQRELQKRGMGLVLDIVPNHMAASHENPWWMDVLEHGPDSAYASYFDIDWNPPSRNLVNRLLLPVLAQPFGEVLDSGGLTLSFAEGKFFILYGESSFPVAPKSYRPLLKHRIGELTRCLPEGSSAYEEYSGIIAALSALSDHDRAGADIAADRRLRFEATRDRLRQLAANCGEIRQFIERNLQEFNGHQGNPASFVLLQRLLGEQYYSLSFWQNTNESINYRRFFTITDLVGVRVEEPVVFEAIHGLVLRLIPRAAFTGLRIDHIDGLRDPSAYLQRLQDRLARSQENGSASTYVIVEKILERDEQLPADWPVSGTTGYEFLNHTNRLFVHPDGVKDLERVYANFIGQHADFGDLLYQKKKLVMSTLLGVEMRSLGRQLVELANLDRYARDLPASEVNDALIETTACMPVYRTYIRNLDVPPEATSYIEKALQQARKRKPSLNPASFDFVYDVLLVRKQPHVPAGQRELRLAFVTRWQQFTGPIVAKGLEDTALYVYYPLLSLNEVGGDPRASDLSDDAFYEFVDNRQKHWPHSLNASTTHDTKRAEDVRARLNVLSEISEEWESRVNHWAKLNLSRKQKIQGLAVPDRNEEMLLYQTLLGAWPLEDGERAELKQRLQSYVVKATREAMVHTRWTRPNVGHEEALTHFVDAVLEDNPENEFLADFRVFQKKIAYHGMINGLSQTLLKIISPGVPDFYQGSELWDLRLVDPDNRGSVDFEKRKNALNEIMAKRPSAQFARELADSWETGHIKLYAIMRALHLRRSQEALFSQGSCLRLSGTGARGGNIFGLARHDKEAWAVLALPRWLARSQEPSQQHGQFWGDGSLLLPKQAPRKWRNIFTEECWEVDSSGTVPEVAATHLFSFFPVALLTCA